MKVLIEDHSINLPDLLIVGAAKSGTTSLTNFLMQHSQVSIPEKEPNFLAFYNINPKELPQFVREKGTYDIASIRRLYQHVPEQNCIVDASISYLPQYKTTIPNIQKLYGQKWQHVKILMILRNPAERAFSHYEMFCRNGVETLSFEEAIKPNVVADRISKTPGYNYIGNSLYYDQVKSYLDVFKHVKIYLTEDLKNPDRILRETLDFVGLSYESHIDTKVRFNQGGIPKNKFLHRLFYKRTSWKQRLKRLLPKALEFRLRKLRTTLIERGMQRISLDPKLKQTLVEQYFIKDIEKLEGLINRDLSAWKMSKS